jgi:hypothetical protein
MCRDGRALLLWGLAFYAAALVVPLRALDLWQPTLREAWWEEKWQRLRQRTARAPDRPLLVMLGSSRTDDAFQARRLDGMPGPGGKPWLACNLGVPMAGPLHHGLHLDEMLEAGVRPRLLLVEALPALLNEPHRGSVSEEDWTPARWLSLPQLARLWPYFARPGHKGRDWLESRLAPWYAFRSDLQGEDLSGRWRSAPGDRTHDAYGYRTLPPVRAELPARVRECIRALYAPGLGRLRVGTGPRRALCDLLARCRRERIAVVLVLLPESTEFRSWYAPGAMTEVREALHQLRDAYGTSLIDASGWLADADFRDGHHVREEGARVFTERLIAELANVLRSPG